MLPILSQCKLDVLSLAHMYWKNVVIKSNIVSRLVVLSEIYLKFYFCLFQCDLFATTLSIVHKLTEYLHCRFSVYLFIIYICLSAVCVVFCQKSTKHTEAYYTEYSVRLTSITFWVIPHRIFCSSIALEPIICVLSVKSGLYSVI